MFIKKLKFLWKIAYAILIKESRWRNKKHQGDYTTLGLGLCCNNNCSYNDLDVVIYTDYNLIYTRHLDEFCVKFESLN